jgi:hypothetical protein
MREGISVTASGRNVGELYCTNQPRTGSNGFDLFAPANSIAALADN